MRAEFLERYEARIARESSVYSGITPLLNEIKARGAQWGIVTNKPYYLAEKLVHEPGFDPRLQCAHWRRHSRKAKTLPSALFHGGWSNAFAHRAMRDDWR